MGKFQICTGSSPSSKADSSEALSQAAYLYSAMADIAYEYEDMELQQACETIFDDIFHKKMYITGGIGSSRRGEAFTVPYDLPNETAYAESCAAIALAMFANRMLRLNPDVRYADVVETVLYNGFLANLTGRQKFSMKIRFRWISVCAAEILLLTIRKLCP